MFKKTLAFATLLALSGCQSGAVDLTVTNLTDQLTGCVTEALAQKGGSVVIKSPAQYSNFQSEINKLGDSSELCESGVTLPEIDFGEGVFVAKNISEVCSLDVVVETSLDGELLTVNFVEDMTQYEGQECETNVDGVVAAQLTEVPEEVSSIVIE
ncbi:MAG: hypothetical protein ACI9QC_000003 [Oceanicoccus sp.]|jgi:hypothetical protein